MTFIGFSKTQCILVNCKCKSQYHKCTCMTCLKSTISNLLPETNKGYNNFLSSLLL